MDRNIKKELLNKHEKNLAEIRDEVDELEQYINTEETMLMDTEYENHISDLRIWDEYNGNMTKLSDYTDHIFSYSISSIIIFSQSLLHKIQNNPIIDDLLQHIASRDSGLYKWDRSRFVKLNIEQEPMKHSMGWKYATHYFTYAKMDYDKFNSQELIEILELNKDLLDSAGAPDLCPTELLWKQLKGLKQILQISLNNLILYIQYEIDPLQVSDTVVVAHPKSFNFNGTEYHLSDVLNWAARNATVSFSIYRALINTLCHNCGWYDLYVLRRYAKQMTYIIQDPMASDINWSKDNPRLNNAIARVVDSIANELKEDSINV